MDREQAIQAFWSQFGIKAYDESTVPDGAALPYITYGLVITEFLNPVIMNASIWYRSTSWAEITAKSEQIYEHIGLSGVVVPYDGGSIWIKRGGPFAQRMSDPDDTIRRIYLTVEIEYFTPK